VGWHSEQIWGERALLTAVPSLFDLALKLVLVCTLNFGNFCLIAIALSMLSLFITAC